LFIEGTPRLTKLLSELKFRIENNDVSLFRHLNSQGIEVSVFAKHFITLFTCDANTEIGSRMLEIFLCEGEEALFSIIIKAILSEREKLFTMKYEELFTFFSKSLGQKCLEVINGQVFRFLEVEEEYTFL
jgi:GTPase-activating protein